VIDLFALLFAVVDVAGDSDLAGRLKRREPQAMADLYDRYGKLVYSVIVRIVRDEATAEDLTQEAFLRVWNRVQFFDQEKGSLGPWLLAVARNRAIDYLRSADGRMGQQSVEFDALSNPSLFGSLEKDIWNNVQARTIREALDKLPANQRQVIELAYYEGLSQSEMAERMKQPLGTVKTWVRSALKALRAELGEVQTA